MRKDKTKDFIKFFIFALIALVICGCSNLVASDFDDSSSESSVSTESGRASAAVFIPDYSMLAGTSNSSARAVAPQTATVRLGYRTSSAADYTYDDANSLELSSAVSTDTTNASGIAGYSYSFTFTLPAATYSAGNIIIEMLGSSGGVLSSGVTSEECTISADSETTASLSMIPSAKSSSKSGSLSAGEMKFFKIVISEETTLTIDGDVALFVFDSNGKLVNNDDIAAPLKTSTSDGSTTATIPAAETTTYYIGIYSETALEYSVSVDGEDDGATVLFSAAMPESNWTSGATVAANVTTVGDFNAAYMNYYCVNGAYAGMSYTETPKAYVSIAAEAFADVDLASVELVIKDAYSKSSSCNPQIAVSNGSKIIALSSVLSSQSKSDVAFYLNPSDFISNGLFIFTVDNTVEKNSSWSFSGITASESDTGLDSSSPSSAADFVASGASESVELSWTASSSDDVSAYILTYSAASESEKSVVLASSVTSKTIKNLAGGSEYSFSLFAVDVYGNKSSAATAAATPAASTKSWYDYASEDCAWYASDTVSSKDNILFNSSAGFWNYMYIDASGGKFSSNNSSWIDCQNTTIYIPMTKDGTITINLYKSGQYTSVTGGSSALTEDSENKKYTYSYTTSDVVNGAAIKNGAEIDGIEDEYTYAKITFVNESGSKYIGDIIREYSN